MARKNTKKQTPSRLGIRAIASMGVLALVFALLSVVVIQLLSELALSNP
jgi:hypothetical protein